MESPSHSPEKKPVPKTRQLARGNLLALYWDKPVSSLTVDGNALPGVQERFLPEDLTQTLGSFLSGNAETVNFRNRSRLTLDSQR